METADAQSSQLARAHTGLGTRANNEQNPSICRICPNWLRLVRGQPDAPEKQSTIKSHVPSIKRINLLSRRQITTLRKKEH
ncbi:hypothetical protein GQ600_15585 [Phytophthora cactorum]|nr:hypothetical protein GQ600_15585 [Phytophthora cactorum]